MTKVKRGQPFIHPFLTTEESLWLEQGEVEAGQNVSIAGTRGAWKFLALVTNTQSGEQWVDVIRPTRSGGVRSFAVARVRYRR